MIDIILSGLKGSGSGPPSSLTSPMTSPTSSPHHHPLVRNHHHHNSHRSSLDSVFLDLESSGGDYGGMAVGLGPSSAELSGGGSGMDPRALAKDRQKKDNHNMSKILTGFNRFFIN